MRPEGLWRVAALALVGGPLLVAASGAVFRSLGTGAASVVLVELLAILAVAAAALHPARESARAQSAEEKARRDLARHEASRSQFLADVAHDLRAPLVSMQLALEEMTLHGSSPAQLALLRRMLNDVVLMGSMVTNLRLSARADEGWDPRLDAPRIDLAAVVRRASDRGRAFARVVDVSLEAAWPEREVLVRCHAMLAEQALSNLVENAIRHHERGGHVSILLEADATSFSLSVIDDGPGVPPSELPRLGERAFRGQRAKERDAGTGLGLAIVGWVCEVAGWRLRFAPTEPRGLTATIEGPITEGSP